MLSPWFAWLMRDLLPWVFAVVPECVPGHASMLPWLKQHEGAPLPAAGQLIATFEELRDVLETPEYGRVTRGCNSWAWNTSSVQPTRRSRQTSECDVTALEAGLPVRVLMRDNGWSRTRVIWGPAQIHAEALIFPWLPETQLGKVVTAWSTASVNGAALRIAPGTTVTRRSGKWTVDMNPEFAAAPPVVVGRPSIGVTWRERGRHVADQMLARRHHLESALPPGQVACSVELPTVPYSKRCAGRRPMRPCTAWDCASQRFWPDNAIGIGWQPRMALPLNSSSIKGPARYEVEVDDGIWTPACLPLDGSCLELAPTSWSDAWHFAAPEGSIQGFGMCTTQEAVAWVPGGSPLFMPDGVFIGVAIQHLQLGRLILRQGRLACHVPNVEHCFDGNLIRAKWPASGPEVCPPADDGAACREVLGEPKPVVCVPAWLVAH